MLLPTADVKGFATLKMPDGSSEKAASFVIKELRIDNVILKDVPAFVLKKQTVPFLIGNSTFDGIGGAVQEGSRLIIGETTEEQNTEQASLEPEDSLKDAAQKHLDAKEYAQAASCFEALSKAGALNMFTSYEYSVVLNILERDDETIAVSEQWLSEYEGKSLTMDYWVYDCLGDAYARKKDVKPAIEKYQQAISAYCKLFNTTEKAIRKSSFQDETLGITLFNLSRMYARPAGNQLLQTIQDKILTDIIMMMSSFPIRNPANFTHREACRITAAEHPNGSSP